MIRIGILGAGTMGMAHALAYAGMPGAKVVGVYSREAARAAAVAAICGAEACTDPALLIYDDDIDAIDVCLPTAVHADYVLAACGPARTSSARPLSRFACATLI